MIATKDDRILRRNSRYLMQMFADLTKNPSSIRLITFGLVVLAFGMLFRQSWFDMADAWWNTETYSHGLLVAPIGIWLVWRSRFLLAHFVEKISVTASLFGVLSSAVIAVFWVIGSVIEAKVIMNFCAVAIILAIAVQMFGFEGVFKARFSFLFLFFMVPFGQFLEPLLMEHTATATVWALRATGLPVYRDGMQFVLPTGSWSVVEACSGLRYVIAAIILSALFAHLWNMSTKGTGFFVLLALLVAILANWIRAYTVVLVGHYSNMKYGTGDDHVWYGWVFFGVVMYGVFALGQRFGRPDIPSKSAHSEISMQADQWSNALGPNSKRWLFSLGLSFCIVIAAQLIAAHISKVAPKENFLGSVSSESPRSISPNAYKPFYENPVSTAYLLESSRQGTVETHFVYYASQATRNSKMIGNDHGVLAPAEASKWRAVALSKKVSVQGLDAKETVIIGPDGRRIVWNWYQIGVYQTASNYKAALYTALNLFAGKGDHAVAVVMTTQITDSEEEARQRLIEKQDVTRKKAQALFN